MLGNYKIRVNSEAESKEAQWLFCVLGGSEDSCDRFEIVCLSGGKVYTDRVEFFEHYDDCEEITLPKLRDLVTQSNPTQQCLISWADALRALADGKEVEGFSEENEKWIPIVYFSVQEVVNGLYKFRLKPRTVKLEIEIPTHFEPKSGDMVWCLNELSEKGYEARTAYDEEDFTPNIGYWKSEDEIKQVVTALRSALTTK